MQYKVNWPLGNGQSLPFDIYDGNTTWNDVPGLYIICRKTVNGWVPLYIGQAASFKDRLANHNQLGPAIRMGATHIHAAIVSSQSSRDQWEKMLIQTHQPPLNVQLRNALANALRG